jgi:DNA-binding transcriptional ArsR family regulator
VDHGSGSLESDLQQPLPHYEPPPLPVPLEKKEGPMGHLEQGSAPAPPGREGGRARPTGPSVDLTTRAAGEKLLPQPPWWEHPAAIASASALVILLAWLYSRFNNPRDLLASPVRQKLIAAVKAQAGITQKELADQLGLRRQSVAHHLKLLERAQMVVLRFHDGALHVYATTVDAPPSKISATRRVLDLVRTRGSIPRADVHQALADIPRRTCNAAIKSLLTQGKVEEIRTQEGARLRLAVS